MSGTGQRNRLTPWYIGIAIILAAVGYVGYQMSTTDCGMTPTFIFLVLGVIPAVYLVLMYYTFTSQK